MSDRGLKKAVIIGASIGALITLGAALSMDVVFSNASRAPGGTRCRTLQKCLDRHAARIILP
jgi:hypothetical protein